MWGDIVERFGRTVVTAVLAVTAIVTVTIGILVYVAMQPNPISPEQALQQGGRIVTLPVYEGPVRYEGGSFSVETLTGRPPAIVSKWYGGSVIEFVVGPDWSGHVVVTSMNGCRRAVSEMMGGAYGFDVTRIDLQQGRRYC